MRETKHFLKTWPKLFDAMIAGAKTFEYRKNDRDFRLGDLLVLQEYDPETKVYSGFETVFRVRYMLTEAPGLPEGYCIMGVVREVDVYKAQ